MGNRREGTHVAVSLTPADWLQVRMGLLNRLLELRHLIADNAVPEFVSEWKSDLARVGRILEAIMEQGA